MAYNPIGWVDGETPVNAENLGKMDDGIEAANDAIDEINTARENGEFKGDKGDPGVAGADGVSATHSWNGTVLTITSASGSSSADLKGEKGDTGAQGIQGVKGDTGETGAAGKDGEDGYTPVKGTDYFTEADKQEIAEQAASLVELPETAMQPLTFTGAVEATYDGSKAVSVEIPAAGGGGESYIAKLTTIASGTILKGTAAGITDTGLTIGDLRKYKYFVLYVKSQGQNLYWGLSWKAAWGCIGRWQHSSIAFTYEWKDSNKTVLEIFVGSGTGYESKVGIYDNSSDANPPLYKYPSLIIMGADSMPVYVQNGAELTVDAIWEIKGCLEYES